MTKNQLESRFYCEIVSALEDMLSEAMTIMEILEKDEIDESKIQKLIESLVSDIRDVCFYPTFPLTNGPEEL